MTDILKKLTGGDLRPIGRVAEVVQDILDDPDLFECVLRGMLNEDPIIRMRSADVVEKITSQHPQYLSPHKDLILKKIAGISQKEVRWHVVQLLPRLNMDPDETQIAVEILKNYLNDDSRIVRTFAMDSLTHFVEANPTLEPWIISLIEELVEDGSPSMRARGRKLLTRLKALGKDD
jgi:hypothetical protein